MEQSGDKAAHMRPPSHPIATASALAVGAVVLVVCGLVAGTLWGPGFLRANVPTLADELGILSEPETQVERLDDGFGGELARRTAAVSAELGRSALNPPDLDAATAGVLQGLVTSCDQRGSFDAPDGLVADAGEGRGAAGDVSSYLRETAGVVRFDGFRDGAADDVRHAVDDLVAQGATSVVLDLRHNGGGSFNAAVAVASLFLSGGTVAETIGPDGAVERVSVEPRGSDGAGLPFAMPVAVLVSSDTAGSAEMVAAALQAHRRAVVVGQTTAGDGSVRTAKTLSFGGSVSYATQEFRTPDGARVEGVGVEADLAVRARADAASGPATGGKASSGAVVQPSDAATPQEEVAAGAWEPVGESLRAAEGALPGGEEATAAGDDAPQAADAASADGGAHGRRGAAAGQGSVDTSSSGGAACDPELEVALAALQAWAAAGHIDAARALDPAQALADVSPACRQAASSPVSPDASGAVPDSSEASLPSGSAAAPSDAAAPPADVSESGTALSTDERA